MKTEINTGEITITLTLSLTEARALQAALRPILGLGDYTDMESELAHLLEKCEHLPGPQFNAFVDFEHDVYVRDVEDCELREWEVCLGQLKKEERA